MKKLKGLIRDVFHFSKENYIITGVFAIIGIVILISIFKLFSSEDEYIYAKVKVSQGLWWANTLKPAYWLSQSLQKGDTELSVAGKPIVEILEVRRYPIGYANGSEQYDVFLTVRMRADLNNKTGMYSFKRSKIMVGSPVDFEFTKVMISGTIMELSDEPFKDKVVDKVVTLEKKESRPWEYHIVQKGSYYFDGESKVVEVLETAAKESFAVYSSVENNYPVLSHPPVDIVTKVRLQVVRNEDDFIFKNEIPIVTGRIIDLPLKNSVLDNFVITKIE